MESKLIKIINNELGHIDYDIDKSTELVGDLGLDELEIDDIITEVYTQFNISLMVHIDYDDIITVNDLIKFVEKNGKTN